MSSHARPPLTFVTGNAKKLEEFRAILASSSGPALTVQSVALDLPELQGADPLGIARDKCVRASELVNGPVITEDTSLCFNALKGLPGAYIKWFLEKLGHDGLNRMLDGFEDRSGYAQCVFSFCEGLGHEVIQFVGTTDGRIVRPRGPRDFGWDPIFQPDGHEHTYAEMDKSVKNAISHRYKALSKLRDYLIDREKRLNGEL